jgi:hypothetical protein
VANLSKKFPEEFPHRSPNLFNPYWLEISSHSPVTEYEAEKNIKRKFCPTRPG